MWNQLYVNRFCYKEDKFVDHKLFCERIVMSKSNCNTNSPKKLKFLKIRASKHMAEKQRQDDINHNTKLLIKKITEMERKPQHYHPSSQKFLSKASSYRFSMSSAKQRDYVLSDNYLKGRITSAKTAYSVKKSIDDYKRNAYIGGLIKNNSKHYNPFLNFATPDDFQRNLYKTALITRNMFTSPNKSRTIIKNKRKCNSILIASSSSFPKYRYNDDDNNYNNTQQSWNRSLKTTLANHN